MTVMPILPSDARFARVPPLPSQAAIEAEVVALDRETDSQPGEPIWLWIGSRLVAQARDTGSRFVGETCGASALEYTVILALMIASLYLGIEFVARPAATTFAKVVDVNGDETNSIESVARSAPAPAPSRPLDSTWLASEQTRHLVFAGFVFTLSIVMLSAMVWRHWQEAQQVEEEKKEDEGHLHVFDKRQQIARTLSVHLHELLERGMTVGHVMSKLLSPVSIDTPRKEVERVMRDLHVRHLLVVDSEGLLAGIISDRDLIRREGETAGDMMTANPLSTTTCSPLNPAITLLIQRRISCLPVIEQGKPIGVLTTTDVMMTLQCMLHEMHKLGEKERKASSKSPTAANASEITPTLA